jgi:hypothetical protein
VRPEDHLSDCELLSLARDTRVVADSIAEWVIHDRLIEIADELLDLACSKESFG